MPELPEIETLRRELGTALAGRTVVAVKAYRAGLREPFPQRLLELGNAPILAVERRSKYLKLGFAGGEALIHLGMSGQLRLLPAGTPAGKHDHIDFIIDDGQALRLRDPRRFGTVLWVDAGARNRRLENLGPEPLSADFSAGYLAKRLAGRKGPVKNLLMNAGVVVGVGNIYATEALFDARISPLRPAGALAAGETRRLVASTRKVLEKGIALGGASMRDYVHADGGKGGFLAQAKVYGKAGQPCPRQGCQGVLRNDTIGGRTSTWCPGCQS